jgi:hypothetical protein
MQVLLTLCYKFHPRFAWLSIVIYIFATLFIKQKSCCFPHGIPNPTRENQSGGKKREDFSSSSSSRKIKSLNRRCGSESTGKFPEKKPEFAFVALIERRWKTKTNFVGSAYNCQDLGSGVQFTLNDKMFNYIRTVHFYRQFRFRRRLFRASEFKRFLRLPHTFPFLVFLQSCNLGKENFAECNLQSNS